MSPLAGFLRGSRRPVQARRIHVVCRAELPRCISMLCRQFHSAVRHAWIVARHNTHERKRLRPADKPVALVCFQNRVYFKTRRAEVHAASTWGTQDKVMLTGSYFEMLCHERHELVLGKAGFLSVNLPHGQGLGPFEHLSKTYFHNCRLGGGERRLGIFDLRGCATAAHRQCDCREYSPLTSQCHFRLPLDRCET